MNSIISILIFLAGITITFEMIHLFKYNSETSGALFAVFMVVFGVVISVAGFRLIQKDLRDKKSKK